MDLHSVKETTLWSHLEEGFVGTPNQELARTLAVYVGDLCEEAADRMKRMPAFHPEFTRHDTTHLLRVTETMALILGDGIRALNPGEIALLILAAHFHDQGMIPDADRIDEILASLDFQRHALTWKHDHPNYGDLERRLQHSGARVPSRDTVIAFATLHHTMFADYLRKTHGHRSADYVRNCHGNDPRLSISSGHLAEPLALLCLSHVLPCEDLVPSSGFYADKACGQCVINLPFLAAVLRIADILDFDRDRTPDSLFRAITFSSRVSLLEWEKHRGVQGWTISPDVLRYEMQFDQPIYEHTARRFLDYVDAELQACRVLMAGLPASVGEHYKIAVPPYVDRSRIGPRQKRYIYYDLEFSLSRNEVLALIPRKRLGFTSSLCVRELMQNATDAIRYRQATFATAGVTWNDGKVELTHTLDRDGCHVLTCRDNGVGMDELVVTRFLTRVGRSYYHSPEFALERGRLAEAGVEFEPAAQFGLGFMSCFTVGDRIRNLTRKDHGAGRGYGRPLVVEINGIDGMVVIREADDDLPVGTTVEVTSRSPTLVVDASDDPIRLTSVARGFALAVEFPITVECTVPGIAEAISVGSGQIVPTTFLERIGAKTIRTFEVDLSDPVLGTHGVMREAFVVDDAGVPCLSNHNVGWEVPDLLGGVRLSSVWIRTSDGKTHHRDSLSEQQWICLGGAYD